MSAHEAATTVRREMIERAETCWMSVEDAEITVLARAVALLGRDLAAAAERADRLEAERDSSDAELLDTHNRAEAAEAERDRLEEALTYIEGHLELAEAWEPGEELDAQNAHAVIFDSLRCARAALAADGDTP